MDECFKNRAEIKQKGRKTVNVFNFLISINMTHSLDYLKFSFKFLILKYNYFSNIVVMIMDIFYIDILSFLK